MSNVTIQHTPVTGDGPKCLSKLSDPVFPEYYHDISCTLKGINIDLLVEEEALSTIDECSGYVQLYFTHLHKKQDNIFMCNSAGKDTPRPLFLSVGSLKQLLLEIDGG